MRKQSIPLTAAVTAQTVREAVERAAVAVGGRVTLEATLRSYPGSLHWHVQSPVQSGTIEATYWPRRHELWVSVHANRESAWAGVAFDRFVEQLRELLSCDPLECDRLCRLKVQTPRRPSASPCLCVFVSVSVPPCGRSLPHASARRRARPR
jgi:hypothetical protein